jgi:hypothetical protein
MHIPVPKDSDGIQMATNGCKDKDCILNQTMPIKLGSLIFIQERISIDPA